MELWQEILAEELTGRIKNEILPIPAQKIVEGKCYCALQKIKEILEDDRLDDRECFFKIEEVVKVFEELGSGVQGRHDF